MWFKTNGSILEIFHIENFLKIIICKSFVAQMPLKQASDFLKEKLVTLHIIFNRDGFDQKNKNHWYNFKNDQYILYW